MTTSKNRSAGTHVVKNESAGIQFDPPQKIRMLFISKSQVSPGWSTSLSSTTRTRRNPIFWVLVSNTWPRYADDLSEQILPYEHGTYIIKDLDLDVIQRLFAIPNGIP